MQLRHLLPALAVLLIAAGPVLAQNTVVAGPLLDGGFKLMILQGEQIVAEHKYDNQGDGGLDAGTSTAVVAGASRVVLVRTLGPRKTVVDVFDIETGERTADHELPFAASPAGGGPIAYLTDDEQTLYLAGAPAPRGRNLGPIDRGPVPALAVLDLVDGDQTLVRLPSLHRPPIALLPHGHDLLIFTDGPDGYEAEVFDLRKRGIVQTLDLPESATPVGSAAGVGVIFRSDDALLPIREVDGQLRTGEPLSIGASEAGGASGGRPLPSVAIHGIDGELLAAKVSRSHEQSTVSVHHGDREPAFRKVVGGEENVAAIAVNDSDLALVTARNFGRQTHLLRYDWRTGDRIGRVELDAFAQPVTLLIAPAPDND